MMLAFVGSQEQFIQSQTCFCVRMQLKPPTRPKLYSEHMPLEENDPYCALIPGLPEDLAKICLALAPRSHFPVMGAVSKRWMSFLESKELIAVRKEVGKMEEMVYVLAADADAKGTHWEVLWGSGERHNLPCMPGPTKAGFGVVVLDGKLVVIAGYAANHGKECVLDEVYQYDSVLNRWTVLAKMNVARCDFACAEVNGVIYVAGGFGRNGDNLSSVEVYDPEQNKWTLVESLRRPRWGCFGCSFEGKLYVMGGRSSFTIGNSRFVDVYDPNKHAWGEVKNGCVMVTSHAVLGEKLFCIEWKNQRSLAIFDPADNSWQKIPVPLTGSSSTRFSLGIHDDKLLLFSLQEEPGYQTLAYDPAAPVGSEWCTSKLKPSGSCLCSVTIKA
ncbi:hypothetical protein PR202_ga01484 [Eleusine coracana subsp. coracana]|uniref:Uncharacterized protein n=1 Tax=Eleusine coracana subsp. coracana TaxID=191504 RepID=A0AAV5BF11_ELECO|nr:hypothetical protein PR202_ga00797 [Eleusine coracana subsp. coracana]GJM85694.1 hypothetical protein PR202_ga01484 [Eleusine coracana subsp. coracana]